MGFYALGRQTQTVPSHRSEALGRAAAARASAYSLPTLQIVRAGLGPIRTVNVCQSRNPIFRSRLEKVICHRRLKLAVRCIANGSRFLFSETDGDAEVRNCQHTFPLPLFSLYRIRLFCRS